MKASEIRQLTAEELNTKLNDLKAELLSVRMSLAKRTHKGRED